MNTTMQRPLGRMAAATWLALSLAACQTTAPKKEDPNAKARPEATQGTIRMPTGADYRRVQMAEKGEKLKVYTQVRGMGEPGNEKLLFPARVAQKIGVTPVQIQRRFMDTIGITRRYEVYDSSTSVTAEASDVVVDAQFTSSTQELRPIEGGARVTVTRVQINANLIDRYSGKPLWAAPVVAVGETGASSIDRVVLLARDDPNDPAVQERLGVDYERAMQRAFDKVAERVDLQLRPMGKVIDIDGDSVSVIGGLRNGLQRGDEMVGFSARLVKIGQDMEFGPIKASVALRCDGVGQATSQCDIIRRDPRFKLGVGDYVILTDHSATATRMSQ